MQPLDNAVGLRPTDPRALVVDAFQPQEQLVGVTVLAAAELAAVVAQHRLDRGTVLLQARQHVVVEQLHGGDGQLVRIQPGPSIAAGAVDRGCR